MITLLQMVSKNPGDLFRMSRLKDSVFAQLWLRVGKRVLVLA